MASYRKKESREWAREKLRGVANVRVCDTSVFPTLVTGNTNGAAMAVALRLAQRMGL